MSISELKGKAQTVLGLIDVEDLGITLPHEHLLIDMRALFKLFEPTATSERLLAYQPVSLENLWWVRHHVLSNLDTMQLLDVQVAISEVLRYRYAGGSTLVDLTCDIALGRDPLALARISRATGLNIIMGSGYYLLDTRPAELKMTEEVVAEQIVRDITLGVGNTGIRAGIIGEIGIQWPMPDKDREILRAVSYAQIETGAPVNIHPGTSPDSPFEILDVLASAGADISRVVISHIDRTCALHNDRVKLAKTGCYIEYDAFGWESGYPKRMVRSETNPIKEDLPSDNQRINEIMSLIDEGFLSQILISQDCCFKHSLCRWGGAGYAHILKNMVPLMREKGMSEQHIRTLLVENPKRLLAFV